MPPRRRGPYLIALLALLCGLGAWLTVVATARGDDASVFVYPELPGGEAVDAADAGDVEPPPTASRLQPSSPLRVSIDVRRRARLLPPRAPSPPPPVRLVRGDRTVPCERIDVVAGPPFQDPAERTDERAGGRAGGRTRRLLRFDRRGDTALFRVVAGEAPDEGGPIEVAVGAEIGFGGRVVDAGSGDAVADAIVWSGELERSGQPRTVRTDADGRFWIPDLELGTGIPLVVRARDHALRFSIAAHAGGGGGRGGAAGTGETLVTLTAACPVDLVLGAQVERPELGVVHALPASSDSELRHYPFFWSAIVGPPRLDATGRCRLDDLPRGSSVELAVEHPEAPARPTTVRLRDARTVVVTARRAPVLRGRVLDRDGRPIAGARIESRAPDDDAVRTIAMDAAGGRSGWLLPTSTPRTGVQVAEAGADGRFRIARVHGDRRDGRRGQRIHGIVAITAGGGGGGFSGIEVAVTDADADLQRDFVLPTASADGSQPALLLSLEPRGRVFRLRTRGGAWFVWTDAEAYRIPVGEPALVDVFVTVDPGDGGAPFERVFEALPVAGTFALALDI